MNIIIQIFWNKEHVQQDGGSATIKDRNMFSITMGHLLVIYTEQKLLIFWHILHFQTFWEPYIPENFWIEQECDRWSYQWLLSNPLKIASWKGDKCPGS